MPQGDRELVMKAQKGDMGAFNTLCERYYHRCLNFALNLVRDKKDAEDVCQEAFIYAFEHFSSDFEYRGESSFRSWLGTVVWNKIRASWKKQGLENRRLVSLDKPLDEEENTKIRHDKLPAPVILPNGKLETREAAEIVDELIGRLSEVNRIVAVLYREGFSVGEISKKLDIIPDTIRQRRHRAHRKLRELIVSNPKLLDELSDLYPDIFPGFLSQEKRDEE